MSEFIRYLKEAVEEARSKRGVSKKIFRQRLAKGIGMHIAQIDEILDDGTRPNEKIFAQICGYLGRTGTGKRGLDRVKEAYAKGPEETETPKETQPEPAPVLPPVVEAEPKAEEPKPAAVTPEQLKAVISNCKTIGAALKAVRNELGYSQKEVGTVISIEQTTVSALENGKTKVTPEKLKLFSELYDVALDDLLAIGKATPLAEEPTAKKEEEKIPAPAPEEKKQKPFDLCAHGFGTKTEDYRSVTFEKAMRRANLLPLFQGNALEVDDQCLPLLATEIALLAYVAFTTSSSVDDLLNRNQDSTFADELTKALVHSRESVISGFIALQSWAAIQGTVDPEAAKKLQGTMMSAATNMAIALISLGSDDTENEEFKKFTVLAHLAKASMETENSKAFENAYGNFLKVFALELLK